MRIILIALAVIASMGEAHAAEQLPTVDRGAPYEAARGSLKALGWRPHEVLKEERRCDKREQTCDTYLEAESCLADGLGTCTMLWERDAAVVVVQTKGIDEVVVDRVSCRAGC